MTIDDANPGRPPRPVWAIGVGVAVLLALGLGAWLTLARGSGSPPQTGKGYLGVRVVTAQRALAPGAVITLVAPHTPAAGAGLRAATRYRTVGGTKYPTNGDVIRAIDARDITTAEDVASAVGQRHPGDQVLITLGRGRAITWARVKLGRRPANPR